MMRQMERVYRFRVALKLRKRLWRRIEVKGDQTLGDFDRIIREAFKYYMWDHLSQFFRGKVWRSEGLGEIYPGGGGCGEEKRIDGLDLSEGDKMEYVYDFGDDVQHIITLEKVMMIEAAAKYPRIVSQNKPKIRYCEACEEQGKKIVARWICVDCSNEAGRDVLLCDDCLMMKEHEDHYAEEVLY